MSRGYYRCCRWLLPCPDCRLGGPPVRLRWALSRGALRRSGHSIYKRLSRNEEAKMCLRTHTAKCENILFIIPIKSQEYRRNQGTLLKQYIRSKYKFLCSLLRIGLTLDNINFHSLWKMFFASSMRRFVFPSQHHGTARKLGNSSPETSATYSCLRWPCLSERCHPRWAMHCGRRGSERRPCYRSLQTIRRVKKLKFTTFV